MKDECCNASNMAFIALTQTLVKTNELLKSVSCQLNNLQSGTLNNDVAIIKMMLAQINPMTVAGNYPHIEDNNRYIISTTIRFLDMLNTDLYLMYKTDISSLTIDLPLYFKDADYVGSTAAYEHAVVLTDGTPVLANQLIPNGIYKATYQYDMSYIILDSLTPLNPNIITSSLINKTNVDTTSHKTKFKVK